jgi:hypothetical protein
MTCNYDLQSLVNIIYTRQIAPGNDSYSPCYLLLLDSGGFFNP